MLRSLTRFQATLLLLLLAALLGWSMTVHEPPPVAGGPAQDYSDLRLYLDTTTRVEQGEGYYAAITALQRAHGFPTHPFPTVRLPTLVMAGAWFGWPALRLVLGALLAGTAWLWLRALRPLCTPGEAAGAVILVILGGAMVATPTFVDQHELWAGILLAAAMALRLEGRWPLALLCAALALAIRELALPFVLLALASALWERRWREAAGWAALVAAFAVAVAFHASAVAAHVQPGDLPSQGWNALRGPGAALRDIGDVTLLTLVPPPLRYLLALLPLMGWLAAPGPLARFGLPLFAGYMAMLALFAREQNFYWAIMLLPAYLAGFAFLPRLAKDLGRKLLVGGAEV